jgi:hypothetical protein
LPLLCIKSVALISYPVFASPPSIMPPALPDGSPRRPTG